MFTAFRQTATLSDNTGKFRTSILLCNGHWSEAAIAEQIKRSQLPIAAIELTDEEYRDLEVNSWKRFGYVEKSGDVTTPFQPEEWKSLF